MIGGEEEVGPERRREILEARGRVVAEARAAAKEDEVVALSFVVAGENYAVPISRLAVVLDARGVHPLAGAPRWLLGAAVARARLVPVLDLRQLLKLEGGGMSDLTRVVVIESGSETFGVAVERLEGHVRLPRAIFAGASAGPLRHVTAERVAVLDVDALAEAAAALA